MSEMEDTTSIAPRRRPAVVAGAVVGAGVAASLIALTLASRAEKTAWTALVAVWSWAPFAFAAWYLFSLRLRQRQSLVSSASLCARPIWPVFLTGLPVLALMVAVALVARMNNSEWPKSLLFSPLNRRLFGSGVGAVMGATSASLLWVYLSFLKVVISRQQRRSHDQADRTHDLSDRSRTRKAEHSRATRAMSYNQLPHNDTWHHPYWLARQIDRESPLVFSAKGVTFSEVRTLPFRGLGANLSAFVDSLVVSLQTRVPDDAIVVRTFDVSDARAGLRIERRARSGVMTYVEIVINKDGSDASATLLPYAYHRHAWWRLCVPVLWVVGLVVFLDVFEDASRWHNTDRAMFLSLSGMALFFPLVFWISSVSMTGFRRQRVDTDAKELLQRTLNSAGLAAQECWIAAPDRGPVTGAPGSFSRGHDV